MLTDQEMIAALPTSPSGELEQWVYQRARQGDILGSKKLIFYRDSVSENEFNEYFWLYNLPVEDKSHWGARCKCTSCGEDFTAGYADGSILLRMQEDGTAIPGWISEKEQGALPVFSGERMLCPYCQEDVVLVRSSDIKNGRTYQTLIRQLIDAAGQSTIMYWAASRRLTRYGYEDIEIVPFSAIVFNGGEIQKYNRYKSNAFGIAYTNSHWSRCFTLRDPEQIRYHDCESINMTKVGAVYYKGVDELTSSSAEKTGLEDYIRAEGCSPLLYLKLWRRYPYVENLVKAGFAKDLSKTIDENVYQGLEYRTHCTAVEIHWADLSERKPYKMFGVDKADFRKALAYGWNGSTINSFSRYVEQVEYVRIEQFEAWKSRLPSSALHRIIDSGTQSPELWKMSVLIPYLDKQTGNRIEDKYQLLVDCRRMAIIAGGAELTYEELWPRRLQEAHDRLAEQQKAGMSSRFRAEFEKTYEKCKELEWTDGRLCIKLPRDEAELIQEGKTLRHCVGGYAKQHISGSLILFVRHYRRPERSYYTLNISIKGDKWSQIQLHGYGNERHGENKEHRHSIPQTVIDFVERWEREVLSPWFIKQKMSETRAGKKSKKGKKAA